jgi:hypothetical protein
MVMVMGWMGDERWREKSKRDNSTKYGRKKEML